MSDSALIVQNALDVAVEQDADYAPVWVYIGGYGWDLRYIP